MQILLAAAALLGVLLFPQWATAAPANDDFAGRFAMQLGFADTRTNTEATTEPEEPLTPDDPSGAGCTKQGEAAPGGIEMERTLWWSFVGNGGPITVSTLGSNFDTVLAIYEADTVGFVTCNDDIQTRDPTRPNLPARLASEVVVDTVAGREYAVQVGGCTPLAACGTGPSGSITLRVSAAPPNDDRAAAATIAAGGPTGATNTGATLEPGETTLCGDRNYAKTVWFRWTAPAVGTAAFSAAGFDSVLAVYRGGAPTPIRCNDDALGDGFGGSRVPMIQPPEPSLPVTPGDYLIQVGGYYDIGFSTVAARNGPLAVQVEFTPDPDLDDDGVTVARDCDEANPAIHIGAQEVPNNEVDENCDTLLAYDRDGDRFFDAPVGNDCDDRNPNVNPGEAETRGNELDENCDSRSPDLLVLPTRIGIDVTQFGPFSWWGAVRLSNVLPGSRIEIRCSSSACDEKGKKRQRYRVKEHRSALLLPAGMRLDPGDAVDVRVTKRGWTGRGRIFRIRREKRYRARPYCLDPKGRKRDCGSPSS